MKLIFEVLEFLLEREIASLMVDAHGQINNLATAHHLMGRLEFAHKQLVEGNQNE